MTDLFEELFGQPEESPGATRDEATWSKVAEEEVSLRNIGAVSMEDVFTGDDLDLDRLTEKLDDLIELDCEKRDAPPTDMIRVAYNGSVMWLSKEQAEIYLEGRTDMDKEAAMIQREIKRALKGNIRVLRQEMQTLMAMAFSSLQAYVEGGQMEPELAQETEQHLRRNWQEVSQLMVEMTGAEDHIKELRNKNPQLDAFEDILGEFVNARQRGDKETVQKLQNEIANMQRTYLIMARVLEPDTTVLQKDRLDLQRSKKAILSAEKEMASKRRDILRLEVKRLQKHLRILKTELSTEDGPTDELQITAHLESQGLDAGDGLEVDAIEGKIDEARGQVDIASLEHKVARAEEHMVDEVIDYFEEEVVGAAEGDRVQDKVSQQKAKDKMSKAPPVKLDPGGSSRMATADRHDS